MISFTGNCTMPSPTPAPTLTMLPTPISQRPTVSSGPSFIPTQSPTPDPSSNRVEARTWDELRNALQSDRAIVNVTRDIAFSDWITLGGGQDVTAFCNATGEAAQSSGDYCATLDGGGETSFFHITGGSCLRLIGLRLVNGYGMGSSYGGAISMSSDTEAHLTTFMINDNAAFNGGAFNLLYVTAAVLRLTSCVIRNNEAYQGGVFFTYGYGDGGPVMHLSSCTIKNNYAVRCHLPNAPIPVVIRFNSSSV